ncbi:MAG: hypothetical protein E3J86_03725 [Candidatus Thorarchaeota archaeon]|nr:MAG: hypothetical protein E3J86_03725 [Candidatus Thorarchaeota archaeon]
MTEKTKEVSDLYRELRNISGLCVVIFTAECVHFFLTASEYDIQRFGMYLIITGILFFLLGWKTLQIRGWIK